MFDLEKSARDVRIELEIEECRNRLRERAARFFPRVRFNKLITGKFRFNCSLTQAVLICVYKQPTIFTNSFSSVSRGAAQNPV